MRALVALAVFTLMPAVSSAQNAPAQRIDSRWLPWIGCWQSQAERNADEATKKCLVPVEGVEGGIKILLVTGDNTPDDSVPPLIADGTIRPFHLSRETVDAATCSGSQAAEWSQHGNMLFTRGEVTCENRPAQTLSGIHLLVGGPTWVDVQSVRSRGRDIVEVRLYERVSVPAALADRISESLDGVARAEAARLSSRHLTAADVIESSGKVATKAIEAVLFETKSRIPVSKSTLLSLADAGVTENIIDLMVALAYPKRFVVDQPTSPGGGWDPFGFSMPGWDYSYYTYRGFGLFPIGPYSSWGYWGNCRYSCYYDDSGGGSIAGGGDGADGPGTIVPKPSGGAPGLAVNGQGYTRVRTTDDARREDGGSSNTGSRPSVVNSTSSSSGRGSSSDHGSSSNSGDSGGSGGSSASSGGYSSGGSGGDGGRTAVARE